MEELQQWTDDRLERRAHRRQCPATGKSVYESWQAEAPLLRPATQLPEVFDIVVTRPVHGDCQVSFENHSYGVPFPDSRFRGQVQLVGQQVEIHGCGPEVLIWHAGRCVGRYLRHTAQRVLTDESHYEGEETESLLLPC